MTKYKNNEAFRFKRYAINSDEDSLSFCGLNDNKKRQKIHEEIERLTKDEYNHFKFRYKRQILNNTECTCYYIYIRIDPTLWDIVYQNEGLNEKEATIHAIVTFLYRIVTAANVIYRSVKFEYNGDYLYRFTLSIKRIPVQ